MQFGCPLNVQDICKFEMHKMMEDNELHSF